MSGVLFEMASGSESAISASWWVRGGECGFSTSAESKELSGMVEIWMVDIGKLVGARASVGMEIESGELASRFESDSASTKLEVLGK